MTAPEAAQAAFLLGTLYRVALAAIFAQSAWHALRDVTAHQAAISAYRLLPQSMVPAAAWIFPLLNLTTATLLLLPATCFFGALLGVALLATFATAMLVNIRRGRTYIDCGCGGAGQLISSALIARNIALATLLLAAIAAPPNGAATPAALLCIAGGAAGLATLYFTASQLLANRAVFRAAGIAA